MTEQVESHTKKTVREFVEQHGGTPAEAIRYFNECLGVSAVSPVSFYNWYNGEHPLGKLGMSAMHVATLVYSVGDARHEFAKKMLEG